MTPITPNKLRTLKKAVRERRAARVVAVQTLLVARKQWQLTRKGTDLLVLEDCRATLWTAVQDHKCALRRLGSVAGLPVVKGSHVSPRAKARLVARGIWHDDSLDLDGKA